MARTAGSQVGLMGRTLRKNAGLQTLYYRLAAFAATEGKVLVLDTIPFAIRGQSVRVYVSSGAAGVTAKLGHYTDDGSADPTAVDVDSMAEGLDLNTTGPTDYPVPYAVIGGVVPGGVVTAGTTTAHAMCLTFAGAGTFSAVIAVTVQPVA